METQTRTIGEMKIETQQIMKMLLDLNDGETLTYDQIQATVGVNVQNGSRYMLRSAINAAEQQCKRLFATVATVGVKRLLPSESNGENIKAVESVHRKARRALRRSTRIDFEKLSKDERDALNLNRTVLHFTAESTSSKSISKIENGVKSAGDAMSFGKTLEFFGKK